MSKKDKIIPLFSWGENIKKRPIKKSRMDQLEEDKRDIEDIKDRFYKNKKKK